MVDRIFAGSMRSTVSDHHTCSSSRDSYWISFCIIATTDDVVTASSMGSAD